ncbi:MAG: hypothetical protein H7301_03915 [Cryobacterium sp.]|nr:hypothetical protein [Oligoflexia bacterium]
MMKKFFWLFAGVFVGVGFSSTFADSREPVRYEFKVLAVSEEDATEKASAMLKEGALREAVSESKLLAASVPTCRESGSDFRCETKLVYRN